MGTFLPYPEDIVSMQELIEEFSLTVNDAARKLQGMTAMEVEEPVAEEKWSRKEILGHLIDSASNNHQRFVRVQFADGLSLPGYEQDEWVSIQDYQSESWDGMIALWQHYNLHLIHIASQMPERVLDNRCSIDGSEPVSLRFIVFDYVAHLKHHLHQILG